VKITCSQADRFHEKIRKQIRQKKVKWGKNREKWRKKKNFKENRRSKLSTGGGYLPE